MSFTDAAAAAGLALALGWFPLSAASAQTGSLPQFSVQEPAGAPAAAPQFAEPVQAEAAAASPIGAGAGWSTHVEPAARPNTGGLDARIFAVMQRVNNYFNGIVNLQGRFLQTDPNQKQTKGKFYVQRPGLLRFDYAAPSMMRIVADGRYLSIEDHDLKTVDKYPLESTPFRMLLRSDVDLLRDARITEYAERDGVAIIALEDKSGESAGSLQLHFLLTDTAPGVELKEWVITDPQGLDTRIELSDLERGQEVARDFFATATVGLPKMQ